MIITLLFLPIIGYLIVYALKRASDNNPYRKQYRHGGQFGEELEHALRSKWWSRRGRNVPRDEWDAFFDVVSIVEDDDD